MKNQKLRMWTKVLPAFVLAITLCLGNVADVWAAETQVVVSDVRDKENASAESVAQMSVSTTTVSDDETCEIAMTSDGVTASDEQSVKTVSGTVMNPLYADCLTDIPDEDSLGNGVNAASAGDVDAVSPDVTSASEAASDSNVSGSEQAVTLDASYYTDCALAGAALREQMEARSKNAVIYYCSSVDAPKTLQAEIFEAAIAHTGVSTQGDYLRWSYSGYTYTANYESTASGSYYYAFIYTISYYTTAAQEQEMTSLVETAESSLALSSKTDAEKAEAIYQYIIENVSYDSSGTSTLKYTAYGAMKNKKAVCQGVSLLFYRMALDCGLDARLVSGLSSSGVNHAWNIVRIGNAYYYLDPTYDLGKTASTRSWFLKGSTNFLTAHRLVSVTDTDVANYEKLHQTSAGLVSSYTISSTDYVIPDTDDSGSSSGSGSSGNGSTGGTTHTHTKGSAVKENVKAATYLSAGSYDQVVYCSGCGKEMSRITVTVPKLTAATGLYTVDGKEYYFKNGVRQYTTDVIKITGVRKTDSSTRTLNGVWYNLENGVVVGDTVAKNSNGWWRIATNGQVDFSYTGFAKNANGWWYLENGKVSFGVNSVIKDTRGLISGSQDWWYVVGSKVTFIKTVAKNANGWWCIEDGKVDFTCNSVEKNANGWWKIKNGKVDFSYTGLAENENGCWHVKNGKVDFTSTDVVKGVVNGESGWWYVQGGKVTYIKTVAKNANGWWKISDGKVDFSFNGLAQNSNGWWYIRGGKVQFGYTGSVSWNGRIYNVSGGKVVS